MGFGKSNVRNSWRSKIIKWFTEPPFPNPRSPGPQPENFSPSVLEQVQNKNLPNSNIWLHNLLLPFISTEKWQPHPKSNPALSESKVWQQCLRGQPCLVCCWSLCLSVSQYPSVSPHAPLPKLFDELAQHQPTHFKKHLLGVKTDCILTGQWLIDQLFDWKIRPGLFCAVLFILLGHGKCETNSLSTQMNNSSIDWGVRRLGKRGGYPLHSVLLWTREVFSLCESDEWCNLEHEHVCTFDLLDIGTLLKEDEEDLFPRLFDMATPEKTAEYHQHLKHHSRIWVKEGNYFKFAASRGWLVKKNEQDERKTGRSECSVENTQVFSSLNTLWPSKKGPFMSVSQHLKRSVRQPDPWKLYTRVWRFEPHQLSVAYMLFSWRSFVEQT